MNKIRFSFVFLVLFISSCSTSKLLTKSKINDKLVLPKNFNINVHTAIPMRMDQIQLSTSYSLKIHGDSATAYLPYYGNASVAPIDANDMAVDFSNKIKDVSRKRNKQNDGWEMIFSVKSMVRKYRTILRIYDNGKSSITISSYDRDKIDYLGNIE